MRGTITTTTLLLAAALAGPAWAQDGHEGHAAPPAGHEMRMGMHAAMPGKLTEHAAHLNLSAEQVERLESLDQRLEAEKERHHAEMKVIHETAMGILTDGQRERMHEMMETMRDEHGDHEGREGHGAGHEKRSDESGV